MTSRKHMPLKNTESPYFSDWESGSKKRAAQRHNVRVKLLLKSENPMEDLDIPRHLSLKRRHELFSKHINANDRHIKAVRRFARDYRLKIEDVNKDIGIVTVSGTVAAMNKAFKVDLHYHALEHPKTGEKRHLLGHAGKASIPVELHDIVKGVIGLNTPPATHQVSTASPESVSVCAARGFTSAWFAEYYKFPKEVTGKGQRIAIISCGGGYDRKDFAAYFEKVGIKDPPKIKFVTLDGTENTPGVNAAADSELYTDCLVAACAAPGATITVYSVENSVFGFADGIKFLSEQGAQRPHVVSYSWGASETNYSQDDVDGVNRKLQYAAQVSQMSVFCAAGDFGSTNSTRNTPKTPLAVQYPASSPWVTGCGGTMFEMTSTGKVRKEIAWNAVYLYDMLIQNASGGGFSQLNKRPGYQKEVIGGDEFPRKVNSQRGVPDIAGYANISPDHFCYWILVQGQNWVTGGTSSVAPLWAALTARLNEALKTRVGFFNPLLYKMHGSRALKSITDGNNCMSNGPDKWHTCPGWDPCTGLGVPNGQEMLTWLQKELAE